MERRITLDPAEVAQRYRSGATAVTIGRELGCCTSTVLNLLRRAAEPRRPAGRPSTLPTAQIVELYADGVSTTELARRFAVAHTTIRSLLARAGVPRRSRDEGVRVHYRRLRDRR